LSKKVLNVKEAAGYLGISPRTLNDWRYKTRKGLPNKGPKYIKMGAGRGGRVVYPITGLDRFALINTVDSDA
jgi:hypothetical protein